MKTSSIKRAEPRSANHTGTTNPGRQRCERAGRRRNSHEATGSWDRSPQRDPAFRHERGICDTCGWAYEYVAPAARFDKADIV